MQVIWSQGGRQLRVNHMCSPLRRFGVGYHVKVPQLLVVRGTDQYFTKCGGDQYRNWRLDYSGRQTLWHVFTRILQGGLFVVFEMFRVCARATDLPQSIGPFVRMGRHAPGGGKAPAVLQVRQEALPHPRGAAAKTARNSALPLTYGKLA